MLLAMLFDFVLIGLEMQLSVVNIVSLKSLLTMVTDIYTGKLFMPVLDRTILQKSKKLMSSLQFVIRPLISKLLNSSRSP